MFDLKSVTADAKKIEAEVEAELDGREKEIVAFIKEKVNEIAKAIGGHIAVSGGGHFHDAEGRPNDKLWLNFETLPAPDSSSSWGSNPSPVSIPQPADGVTMPDPTPAPSSGSSSSPLSTPEKVVQPQPSGFPGESQGPAGDVILEPNPPEPSVHVPQPSGFPGESVGSLPEPDPSAGVIKQDLSAGLQASQGWMQPGEAPGMEPSEDGPNSAAGGPSESPVAPGSSNDPDNAGSEHPPPAPAHLG